MSAALYFDKRQSRINHIEAHRAGDEQRTEKRVYNIEHGAGDPNACIGLLSDHTLACAMSSWFTHHDLASMRGWCYVASRLDQELYRRVPDTMGPGGKMLQLLKPLLSNNAELIDWFAHHDAAYDRQRIDNPKMHDFWAYQTIVALRGEWSQLKARCRIIVDSPPKAKEEQKYLVDYQFYSALAQGNVEGMQGALRELVSPRMLHRRSNDESGYTDDLISTPAVIYAKIAWLHGFKIAIETPYIPAEWLPMDPLPCYNTHYKFLR